MNRSSNLNMYLPEGTDYRDVSQLTANFSTLDGSVGALAAGMAIVSVGNTHAAIASGQYVYIMNHASLSEGLYKATTAISANTTLSGSNVTAVSGAMNAFAKIKTSTFTMTEADSLIRLDTRGINVNNFIRAIVRGTNNITCLPYSYNTAYYVKFVNTDTLQIASGTYEVHVMYWE